MARNISQSLGQGQWLIRGWGGWSYARLSLCSLFQTGVPGLDRSEAIKIRKGKTHHSHHNSQLRMGRQPWGQLPGQTEVSATGQGLGSWLQRVWEQKGFF